MEFQVGNEMHDFSIENFLIAGYTSKNQEELKAHIKELGKIGVEPPKRIPMIYQISPELLTTGDTMSTVKNDGSGEVEVMLLSNEGQWYVGLGSDHTDRVLETVSVQKSKQVCAKPITKELWKLEDIEDHWDEIELNSWVEVNGETQLYQSGKLDSFMSPDMLLEIIKERNYSTENAVIFCGTLSLLSDGFIYGERFKATLNDKKRDRAITLDYKVEILIDAEAE